MKLEINIDENKILELAKTSSMNELPNSIVFEAKRQAIGQAVDEIKSKLVNKPYWSGSKEELFREVGDYLFKQIDSTIKQKIEDKFSEKNIENMVSFKTEKVIKDWLEKKIYERLNEIKADITFCSERELREEREERELLDNE